MSVVPLTIAYEMYTGSETLFFPQALIPLSSALWSSHLDYCNSFYIEIFKYNLNCQQRIKNSLAIHHWNFETQAYYADSKNTLLSSYQA